MEWEPLFDIGCVTGRPAGVPGERMDDRRTLRWYKGSVHVHTSNSDGDSTPAEAARWYRRHGYQFVVITDHNRVTPVEELNREFAAENEFLVLSGEEISDFHHAPEGSKPIHINAMGVTFTVNPRGGESCAEVVQNNIDAVNTTGGLAMVNHPNYQWALTTSDLAGMRGCALLEFANCGAAVNNLGFDTPDTEQMWDALLGEGLRLFGVASDDSHHFKVFSPLHDNPGRGWIMIRCGALTTAAVLDALARGEFYAATGVALSRFEAGSRGIRVEVEPRGHTKYSIEFIGRGGASLRTVLGTEAEYLPDGTERYIRVRVTDSNGLRAWTQPVFPAAKRQEE